MKKFYLLSLLCIMSFMNMQAQVTDIATNLQFPYDAALYGNDLYIAELGAGRLVKVDITAAIPAPIEAVLTGLANPAAMTLDGDFLYYGESNLDRISRINLTDATPTPEVVVNTGLATPNDLFIDGDILYITDEGNDRLMSVNLTETFPIAPVTIASGLNNPLGITKFGDDLYLSIFGTASIAKVDITQTPAVVTTVLTGLSSPAGLTVNGGFLYIAENTRISRMDLNAEIPTAEAVVTEGILGSRNVAFDGIDLYLAQTGGTFGPTGVVSRLTINTPAFASLADVCANDMPNMLTGASPGSGTYSGPGVTDNGDGNTFSFDPTAAGGAGTYTITYTLGGATASSTLTVVPAPTVTFSTGGLSVQVDAGVQTSLGGGMPAGGVYSGNGVTDDGNGMTYSFDPATAGEGDNVITYTFTDANGCSGEQGAVITVTSVTLPGERCGIAIDINSLFGQAPGEAQLSEEYDITGYSDDPSDPNSNTCFGDISTFTVPSIWFSFTGDGNNYTIRSTGNIDPFGTLYTGECGALTEVVCNDDFGGSLNFSVEISTEAGVEYSFLIGPADLMPGPFNIEVTRAALPGDQCADAIDINSLFGQAEMVPQLSEEYNSDGYSINGTDPTSTVCGFGFNGASPIWYTFTGDGNRYNIASSNASIRLLNILYSGECASLTELECTINNDPDNDFSLELQTEAGVTYSFIVYNRIVGETGTFNIEITNLGTVGVQNIQETAIQLFPNPTTGFFKLQGVDATHVMVFDQLGRQVARFEQPAEQQMDIQALPAGVYVLRIEDTDGQIYSARMVKK